MVGVKKRFTRALLAAYLLLVVACAGYLIRHAFQRTSWNKERLFRQLLSGDSEQRARAAAALARLGAEQHLLDALKADCEETREVGRRALEQLWFTSSGREAYREMQAAYRAEESEDFATALQILDRLLRKYPKYAEGWNRRASVYWQLGEYRESISDCEQALALNPNHYGAWQGLGVGRLRLGEVSEACRCLRTALRIAPHDAATRRSLRRCEELMRVYPSPGKTAKSYDLL